MGGQGAVGSPDLTGTAAGTGRRPLIRLSDFCFAYDSAPVLAHVDLTIDAGTSVVLMGDNGSGKSTLLKALCGLVFASRGSYEFDGCPITERTMADPLRAKSFHQRVGFAFQDSDAQLFCASVAEEVAFGPRQMGLPDREVVRRVDDTCALLGLDELRERAPYTLSGGEKRRVAIACVLSMNPSVLCLDEPLAGLDRRTRGWLADFLGTLKAAGKTLVVATHDDELADELADVLVLVGDVDEDTAARHENQPQVRVNA